MVWWQQKRRVGPTPGRASGTAGIDAPRISESGFAGMLGSGLVDGGTLTIASGSITITSTYHNVAAESGSIDYLAEIKGGYQGRRVTLRCDSDDVLIYLNHNDTSEGTAGNRILFPISDMTVFLLGRTGPFALTLIWDQALDSDNGGWMAEDMMAYFLFQGIADALGDTIYAAAENSWDRLAGNTTTTKKFLTQTGDGAASAAPAWDIPDLLSSLATQTLIAADDIAVTDGTPITPIDSASAITLTSEPTIAAGRNGQIAYIVNVGSYNIILQDVNALGGSLLRFTANTLTIQPGGTLKVRYDSTIGFWIETAILNPQTFTPSISGFTIDSSSADTREVAAAATADAVPDFDLTYVGTPSACSIDIDAGGGEINAGDYPIAVPSLFLTLNSGTTPPSQDFYRGTSIAQVRTFTATATVAGSGGLTRQCTVTYINRRYMGPSAETAALTTAQVLGLDATAAGESGLSTIRTGSFSDIDTGAGEYIWYAYRAALGAGIYFTIEGEVAGFTEKQTTLSHANDYGFTEDFRTWRSDLANVGDNKDVVVATSLGTNRFYMGPSTDTDPISNANILALDDTADGESGLYSSQARTWSAIKIEAGEYLWYCHPDRVADLATIKDGTTGFAIAGSYRTNVEHTNQYGYVEIYRCWRSDNTGIYPSGENVIVT